MGYTAPVASASPSDCPLARCLGGRVTVLAQPGAVYAVDKVSAEICRQLQVTGFAFDLDRAAELSASLLAAEHRAMWAADDAVGRDIKRGPGGSFSSKDLRVAFFDDLGAPVYFRSKLTREPSLGIDALRGYAACHDEHLRALALAVIEARHARKIRSTYIDRIVVGADGRVHPSWLSYGAVSGRWACQKPNLMNLPRPENDPTTPQGGIRSLYHAPEGRALVACDYAQLEMRIAAYASGDPAMIASCESSDLHAGNAAVIFGDAFTSETDPGARKALRNLAKSSGFACCYMAQAETVYARLIASGADVKLRQVEAMLTKMRRAFAAYYRWQNRGLSDCVRTAHVATPILGRRRWLGHDPSPTEAANHPIQGGAADLMNSRTPIVLATLADRHPSACLVAQVHDSLVVECDLDAAPSVGDTCREVLTAPVTIASSGEPLIASFPVDVEISERWH